MAKQLLTPQAEGFGLGVQLQEGSAQFSHGGWNEGFTASLVAFADSGSGVVMMANSDNGPFLFERLGAAIAAEYGWKGFQDRLGSPLMTADLLARTKGADALLGWFEAMQGKGPGGRGLPPQLLGKIGYGLLLADRVPDALKLMEAGIALTPDDAEAHDTLGEAYARAGKRAQAIASYQKSLQLDPKNTNAVRKLEELGARP
jgi:tetratricopeptide (TPR) repeat protein